MPDVLVTGGAGFIGSHTVDGLVEQGYKVRVLDNLEPQVHTSKKITHINPGAEYINGDIRYRKHWIRALEGVEYIIHLAGAVGIAQSFWQVKKYVDVNASGTANLYQAIEEVPKIRSNLRKIVVASSKSCYGEGTYSCDKHGPFNPLQRPIQQLKNHQWEVLCPVCGRQSGPKAIREDKPLQNLNPYSLSKYVTEQLSMDYSYALGIETVAFRYFNVYGSRQSLSNPYTGVMAIFLSRLKNGNPPVIFEDGNQVRDYIHVSDVAAANRLALERGNGVYNLGTGIPTPLKEIATRLAGLNGLDILPHITSDYRPGDNRHDFADNTKLNRDLKVSNFMSLEKGLSELIHWSADQVAVDKFALSESQRKKYLT